MSLSCQPRPLPPVIHLTLHVTEENVSCQIQSCILPYSQRLSSRRCGGILRNVTEGVIRYAMIQGRYTGKWGFPKGRMEAGETEEECACREIEEELGVVRLPPHEQRIVLHRQVYFLYTIDMLPLRPIDTLEVMDVRWMTIEEMTDAELNQAAAGFLRQRAVCGQKRRWM